MWSNFMYDQAEMYASCGYRAVVSAVTRRFRLTRNQSGESDPFYYDSCVGPLHLKAKRCFGTS